MIKKHNILVLVFFLILPLMLTACSNSTNSIVESQQQLIEDLESKLEELDNEVKTIINDGKTQAENPEDDIIEDFKKENIDDILDFEKTSDVKFENYCKALYKQMMLDLYGVDVENLLEMETYTITTGKFIDVYYSLQEDFTRIVLHYSPGMPFYGNFESENKDDWPEYNSEEWSKIPTVCVIIARFENSEDIIKFDKIEQQTMETRNLITKIDDFLYFFLSTSTENDSNNVNNYLLSNFNILNN